MNNLIKINNYLRLNFTIIIYLSIIVTYLFPFFNIYQQYHAEDYKLHIANKNKDEVNTKADLFLKKDDDTEEWTVN